MMFAPGCRKTIIKTAGLPPDNPMLRMSATESDHRAHISQAHRGAVVVRNDQPAVLVRGK